MTSIYLEKLSQRVWDSMNITPFQFVLGVLLCVGAHLGVVLRIEVVLGVNFLFSSIFVWCAAFTLGPVWAVIVAFIGAAHTVDLWGHWYSVLVYTTEAAIVVSILSVTSYSRLSITVLLFWIVVGGPLSMAIYVFVLGFPSETSIFIVSKQVLNGLLNALFANFLVTATLFFTNAGPVRSTPMGRISYSSLLQTTFGLAFIVPILIFEFSDLKVEFQNRIDATTATLEAQATHWSEDVVNEIELGTIFWGSNLTGPNSKIDQPEFREMLSKNDHNTPAHIFSRAPDGTLVQTQGPDFSDPDEHVSDLMSYDVDDLVRATFNGCLNGHFVSRFSGGATGQTLIFTWPLDMVEAFEDNLDISCVSDPTMLQGQEFTSAVSTELSRNMAPVLSPLMSWLGASLNFDAALGGIWPTNLSIQYPMGLKLSSIQENTTATLHRLIFLAALLVFIGAFLDFLFRRWVNKFVFVSERFLKTRLLAPGKLNERFTEDRAIQKWLLRFGDAIEKEEKRKFAAQSNFDILVGEAAIPIFAVDGFSTVSEWNPAMADLTGFSRDEVIGRPISDLVLQWRTVQKGQEHVDNPNHYLDMVGKDGKQVHMLTTKLELSTSGRKNLTQTPPQGRNEGLCMKYYFGQNLRDLKEAQAKLIHASRLAALGEMASSFAHELNQPLNVISLSSGNILARAQYGEITPDYIVSKVERIEEQAIRAGRIIQGIRQFVLKSNDEQICSFDPIAQTRSAIDMIKEQLRIDSVSVIISPPITPIMVCGQPLLFEQAVVNIVSNARHALRDTPIRQRKVNITFDADKDDLKMTIQDWGPGIPDELRARVFEPFFSTKGDEGGTGVGLFMSKSVIEEMNGRLEAVASPFGACFQIHLPLERPTPAPHDVKGR